MMVACYSNLRRNDVTSNGQSNIAYRITVRQLESMIRLSEALARIDLSEEVSVQHVQEAYRLLNKSIIHVDTQNIELEMPQLLPDNVDEEMVEARDVIMGQLGEETDDSNNNIETSKQDAAQV